MAHKHKFYPIEVQFIHFKRLDIGSDYVQDLPPKLLLACECGQLKEVEAKL